MINKIKREKKLEYETNQVINFQILKDYNNKMKI